MKISKNKMSEIKTRIGIITYNTNHLKTQQVVENLIEKNIYEVEIFALPFKQRPERKVLINHRPNQFNAIETKELAVKHNLQFAEITTESKLPYCDYYIITGAGILPAEFVKNRKIINIHPGVIPSARGLDAFKWSIYRGIELGVTMHYIDEHVDSGEVLSIIKTPVYTTDTIESLALRHYEIEIDMTSNFEKHIIEKKLYQYPTLDARMRMPYETEVEMVARFEEYKSRFAKPINTP